MEPIPETVRAIDELDPLITTDDLLTRLLHSSDAVRAVVPALRGMSVTLVDHGVTLTLVASDEETAVLDAMQYLDGGPCVEAGDTGRVVTSTGDDLDEAGWHLFAATTAAHGVASTLSLPLLLDGAVVGSVNLYAATSDAFDGHHEQLAVALDAWPGGAVRNADLTFSTRLAAQQAPQILHDARRIDNAVGMLAARLGYSIADSRTHLEDAAVAAGLSTVAVAEEVIALFSSPPRKAD